jgi:hypothetical protein
MTHVVIFCPAHFAIIRDQQRIFVHPAELRCCAPNSSYDLPAFLQTCPQNYHNPTCLVTFFDGDMSSVPRNLAAVAGPKALIFGDTHHVKNSLQNAIRYALEEPYTIVVGQFARHHLHFFHEAGIPGVTWIPCFSINPFELSSDNPAPKALFVGQTRYHPYRRHILARLQQAGLPLDWQVMPPEQSAQAYSRSLINLNISLNADLNLRNLEILAASGLLMAERLSPESGQEFLLQDHRHQVLFDSADHARELITYYLAHPNQAAAIAAAGHAEYLRHHTPAEKSRQLHAALNGTLDPQYSLDTDARTRLPPQPLPQLFGRIALYQSLQELHRNNLFLRVLFWRGLHREAIDAVDLPRLRATVLTDSAAPAAEIDTCSLSARIERLDIAAPELHQRHWELLCAPPEALADPRLHTLVHQRHVQGLFVPHATADAPALAAFQLQFPWHVHPAVEPPFLSPALSPASAFEP